MNIPLFLAEPLQLIQSVSFDFDGTLSRPDVQLYAAELVRRGLRVWVVTARYDENHQHRYAANPTNADLWAVTQQVGIPKHQVRFMNMRSKAEYLDYTHFVWHLDDNPVELSQIQHSNICHVAGIDALAGGWKAKCERLLRRVQPSITTKP